MLTGGSRVPYDAADSFSDQLANWQPALWSPDNEINIYRDRIVSRARDLVRNDGWANGAVPAFWITPSAPISGPL
jgi:capsid protein